MYFINKNNGIAFVFSQIIKYCFQTFFKFTPEFCTGNQTSQIQQKQTLISQRIRNFIIHNSLSQTFNNGSFTYTRFTDEYRVVFSTPFKHQNSAPNFIISPDYGIQLTRTCFFSQVSCIFFQCFTLIFCVRIIHTCASANGIYRRIQFIFCNTSLFKNTSALSVFLNSTKQKQLAGNISIITFNSSFIHQIENVLQFSTG